jgi:glycosyltransferase involved in cell wall biosynthesis
MRILAFPRDDSNPYQGLLYAEMRRRGARVSYLGRLTPSHTLNLLLLPAELAARRLTGARIVHLHWVFAFSLPGARRFPVLRRAAQAWFSLWLRTAGLLGVRLVWTAHNVLPHGPVFADDVEARRRLVRACDLVIAHAPAALDELAARGAVPRRTAIIPHGPVGPAPAAGPLRTPGAGDGPRAFLFFGKVRPYKGVGDLLAAFASLPAHVPATLTVAGRCGDPAERAELAALARRAGSRAALRLDRVPDAEVTGLLAAADTVVLPFRRVTTSGSAMLALCHGRPLIVPDLPSLADLPDQAVLRYDGTVPGLAAALTELALASPQTLAAMSGAARAYAATTSWPQVARRTMDEMTSVLGGMPMPRAPGQPAGVR